MAAATAGADLTHKALWPKITNQEAKAEYPVWGGAQKTPGKSLPDYLEETVTQGPASHVTSA